MKEHYGTIKAINGNMLEVEFFDPVIQNEVGFALLGEERLKAEVIFWILFPSLNHQQLR